MLTCTQAASATSFGTRPSSTSGERAPAPPAAPALLTTHSLPLPLPCLSCSCAPLPLCRCPCPAHDDRAPHIQVAQPGPCSRPQECEGDSCHPVQQVGGGTERRLRHRPLATSADRSTHCRRNAWTHPHICILARPSSNLSLFGNLFWSVTGAAVPVSDSPDIVRISTFPHSRPSPKQ